MTTHSKKKQGCKKNNFLIKMKHGQFQDFKDFIYLSAFTVLLKDPKWWISAFIQFV